MDREERGQEKRRKWRRNRESRGRQERSQGQEGKETRVEEREEEKEAQQRKTMGDEERRKTRGVVWITSLRAEGVDPLHLWIGLSWETEQEGVLGVWWAGLAGSPSVAERAVRTTVLHGRNKTVLFWFPCGVPGFWRRVRGPGPEGN